MSSCLAKTAGGMLKGSSWNWNSSGEGFGLKPGLVGVGEGGAQHILAGSMFCICKTLRVLLMVQCSVGCSIITKLSCCH